MARTRRRPLPAHQVDPERRGRLRPRARRHLVRRDGLVRQPARGLPDAAGDRLLRRRLHDLLKRTTPQNIVIGGAAGALPPVIGWAAVTGNIGIPALLLFAIVFYWTPPHFWALSLRIRKDYAAAGVPMLPVVKGIPETTRQIALYTVLMVAISLVLLAVARMGADLPRRRGRARRGLPVAGLQAVAARLVRGGLDGRRDRALQVLDQLPVAAVPRGRDRRAGADPGLRSGSGARRLAPAGPLSASRAPARRTSGCSRWRGRCSRRRAGSAPSAAACRRPRSPRPRRAA